MSSKTAFSGTTNTQLTFMFEHLHRRENRRLMGDFETADDIPSVWIGVQSVTLAASDRLMIHLDLRAHVIVI